MCVFGSGAGGVDEWIRGLGWDFTNPVGLDQDLEGWEVLCLCEFCVWILWVDARSRYLYIVLG